jgi:WD40 repeat protein
LKVDGITGAVFNRDESRILTWGKDGAARLWAVGQNQPIQTLEHKGISGAVFNRDESRILTWGKDGAAQLWAVGQNQPIQTLEHKGISGAVFNRDESRILTWGEDGTVQLWDASLDEQVHLDERILEFQVRSATSVYGLAEFQLLNFEEWMAKKRDLEDMRRKRQFSR